MLTRKTIWGVVAVFVVVGLMLVGQTLSQPGQGGQRGQRGGTQGPGQRGPGGQFDPERMRQMMEQRMQEALGATDDEWKVLGPRVMRVQDLNRQIGAGGRGMFGRGMRGGPGGPGGPGADRPGGRGMNRELTEVEKIQQELQTTLENTSAAPDQIKLQLTKLRAAREKAKQELAKAQQDLRQVLTIRQEATLVLMGLLD
jgi:hypothetical protein